MSQKDSDKTHRTPFAPCAMCARKDVLIQSTEKRYCDECIWQDKTRRDWYKEATLKWLWGCEVEEQKK